MTGMVGISIPIFYGPARGPRSRKSRAELHSTEARYRPRATRCSTWWRAWGPWSSAWSARSSSIESDILPQARLQAQSTLSAYTVNKVDFDGLLESHIRLHRYELDYHQALTDYEKSLAALEASVGRRSAAGGGKVKRFAFACILSLVPPASCSSAPLAARRRPVRPRGHPPRRRPRRTTST